MTKIHQIRLFAQPGVSLVLVDEQGEVKTFTVDGSDHITVSSYYGEQEPWSLSLPGAQAINTAVQRYARDGDPSGLNELAGG